MFSLSLTVERDDWDPVMTVFIVKSSQPDTNKLSSPSSLGGDKRVTTARKVSSTLQILSSSSLTQRVMMFSNIKKPSSSKSIPNYKNVYKVPMLFIASAVVIIVLFSSLPTPCSGQRYVVNGKLVRHAIAQIYKQAHSLRRVLV